MIIVNKKNTSEVFSFCLKTMLAGSLLFTTSVAALDLFSPIKNLFGGDEDINIWREPGQYVKIVEQDWDKGRRRAPANSHPVKVNPNDIAVVLASLRAADPEGASNTSVPIFTKDEIVRLSLRLAEALDKSQPRQDVVFAVIDSHPSLPSGKQRSTAGRMFMLGGRLNIIFGDVLQPVNEIDDNGSGKINHFARPHSAGRRMELVDSSTLIATGPGITYWEVRGSARPDWISIDVSTAVAAYRGPAIPVVAETTAVPPGQSDAGSEDNEQLLRERRQMLEEMARLKQELKAKENQSGAKVPDTAVVRQIPRGSADGGNKSADKTADNTVENRLTKLKRLYEKELITSEEYEVKRKEILGDL